MVKINLKNIIIPSFKIENSYEKFSLKFAEDSNIVFGCINRYTIKT